jgi:hypothetical protein
MLIPVFTIVVAPVKARVVVAIPIPALKDVDFAIIRPFERIFWQ